MLSSLTSQSITQPDNQIADGAALLRKLRDMAADETLMARRRQNLYRVARMTLFSDEDGADDALTRALGALAADEHG